VGYPDFFLLFTGSSVVFFEIEAAAYQKHQLFSISRQIFGKFGFLFGEPLHSTIVDPKVVVDVKE
jgi:hypothetical protein